MEYLSDGLRYVAIFLILRTIGNLAYGQYEKYQEKKREQNSLMRDGAGI